MVRALGMPGVHCFVHALEQGDGGQVLAAAELIGQPLTMLTGVVEIEHGSDGVNAQAVEVIFIEPEQGASQQEILDFGTAVIEDRRAPVGMLSQARVGVFVQVRTVEQGQAVGVVGEVGREFSPESRPGLP